MTIGLLRDGDYTGWTRCKEDWDDRWVLAPYKCWDDGKDAGIIGGGYGVEYLYDTQKTYVFARHPVTRATYWAECTVQDALPILDEIWCTRRKATADDLINFVAKAGGPMEAMRYAATWDEADK